MTLQREAFVESDTVVYPAPHTATAVLNYPRPSDHPRTYVAVPPLPEALFPEYLPLPRERTRPFPAVSERARLRRIVECLPAALALTVITAMVWGPLLAPIPFAVSILAFQAYWLWRVQMSGVHAFKGFRLLRKHAKTDWRARYKEHLLSGKPCLPWDGIRHIVIIPNYTEGIEKLRMCLDSLATSEVPEKIFAVLAMEEREGAAGCEKASTLIVEYKGRLGGIMAAYHPSGIPGEIAGKGSNENWAARRAAERLVDTEGADIDMLTITSCDVDSVFHPKYFTCLTYNFATDPNRHRRFWQAPIFYYNNIWDIPAPLRLPHALSGINHLAKLSRHGFLRMAFPQSTYSLSLRMAHDADYWDPDIIPEDWHMFLKCYYRFGASVEVDTMYTPIYMDGIRSRTYLHTFVNYFEQARRHAWGCTDIPYALEQTLNNPQGPLIPRLRRLWAVAEGHLLWSTQWFLVTVARVVPVMVVGAVGASEFPHWFPVISRWLLAPCLGPLLLMLTLDAIMRPRRPAGFRWWQFPIQYGQYFFMAFITFFTSALPALDAQFRLALGKRMEYRVTEKA